MFTKNTSLIIPTKDRWDHLKNLIDKIFLYKLDFDEIIVVDSSEEFQAEKIKKKCQESNIKYFHTYPSTAYQRNFGLQKIKENQLVMFMDDDVIFFEETFDKMNECIKKYINDDKISGFGFNQVDDNKIGLFEIIKKFSIISLLGIYPSKPGQVSKSGWHSKILNLKDDILAEWVFTTICIYKRKDIIDYKFDETFGMYSYLEDLDFSLNLKKKNKKIFLSSKSIFKHPKNIDRSNFNFGVVEIINRYKIVKKHKLSKILFFITIIMRFLISFVKSLAFNKNYFLRCIGNIYSLFILNKKN